MIQISVRHAHEDPRPQLQEQEYLRGERTRDKARNKIGLLGGYSAMVPCPAKKIESTQTIPKETKTEKKFETPAHTKKSPNYNTEYKSGTQQIRYSPNVQAVSNMRSSLCSVIKARIHSPQDAE